MAIRLDSLINSCSKSCKLKLEAGEKGNSNAVVWVYLAEDIENKEFIKSNELIITTGFFTVGGTSLFDFIKALIDRNASGIIINTGKYIMDNDISEEIKKICNDYNLPLYTMPWEIHLTDIMQKLCSELLEDTRKEHNLSTAFRNALMQPDRIENYNDILIENGFDENVEYRVITISGSVDELKLRNIINSLYIKGHILVYKKYTLVIAVNNKALPKLVENIAEREDVKKYSIGISSLKTGIENICSLYNESIDALKAGNINNDFITYYDNIGIMALIFAVKDSNVLKEFYLKKLKIFEDYDSKNNTKLIDTLFYYLKTGGSLSATASLMYTHRNTVGYRMNKIRELSGVMFDSPEERYDYLTAIYVRKALLEN